MEAVLVTHQRGPKERKRRQGPRGWVTKTADIRGQRARTPMPPENRLDLWDVNTRLKSIPLIPNKTRVSFPNETPVSIGIVIFVKKTICVFFIFGVSRIYKCVMFHPTWNVTLQIDKIFDENIYEAH